MKEKKPMQRYVLSSLLVLLLAGYSFADVNEGMNAYEDGDYTTALNELFLPAVEGDAWAQYTMGLMCSYGNGMAQDYSQARQWWQQAAQQGLTIAQYTLGVLYYNGYGVPQDFAAAIRWWRKAAEEGFDGALPALGVIYELGHGVRKDYVAAHMWYNLAAAQGHTSAKDLRDNLAQRMPRAQIAEAQRLAREWHKAREKKVRSLIRAKLRAK